MLISDSSHQHADLEALRDSLTNNRPDLAKAINFGLLKSEAWLDPIAARESLSDLPLDDARRADALAAIGGQLRFHESTMDTLAWLDGLSPEELQAAGSAAVPGAVTEAPEEALPAVARWLDTLPEDRLSLDFAKDAAREIVEAMIDAEGGPRSAAEWAVGSAPEPLRSTAVAEVVSEWAAVEASSLGAATKATLLQKVTGHD